VGRVKSVAGLSLIAVLAGIPLAQAGIPRGAILIADEQDADPQTGVTIARGNAEIKFERQPISGHADSIELNPVSNQIVFKGRAVLSVGRDHFESETVTCGLDFSKCTAGAAAVVQALPISVPVTAPTPVMPDAAATNPR
jgi:hypothetical protein